MAAPYVLARTLKEAHDFGREELGLRVGHYRVVSSAGTIKSVRGADLYLVPGWERRFDVFSMRSAIRWTRMNVKDVAAGEPEPEPQPEAPNNLVLATTWEDNQTLFEVPEGTPEVASVPAPEPETKRRRRRCKECGELVQPDDVERHANDHLEKLPEGE